MDVAAITLTASLSFSVIIMVSSLCMGYIIGKERGIKEEKERVKNMLKEKIHFE
jgi:hypothetical protein